MDRRTLTIEELRVESFPVDEARAPEHELRVRTPFCSAIDLCPTRPC